MFFDGIQDIQGLYRIYVHTTQAHGIQRITQTLLTSFLNQKVSDNDYSPPLRHSVWNVDHKMVILEVNLCYNKFSHLCVKRQNYIEHDTVCMSILFH